MLLAKGGKFCPFYSMANKDQGIHARVKKFDGTNHNEL
jgi:Zn-finger protein